jgi:glycerol-3-phosphate dehydrogenase (NAD(P)+)
MKPVICVLGAGSWGSALALQAANNGNPVLLWGHSPEHIEQIRQTGENPRYLPGISFPENLTVTADLDQVLNSGAILMLAIPSKAFKALLQEMRKRCDHITQIAWATKGFDYETGRLLHEVVEDVLGSDIQTAAISGPTFALEVASGLPTAVTVASACDEFAVQLSKIFHNQRFRTYTSSDLIGVQVGGACKNILAIAAGAADGLGFGANTRAALITRGLTEIMRLGLKLGGRTDTFMGLAGLGDLILTCTDDQSRNRRFGLAIGRGQNQQQAVAEINQAIEGIGATREAYFLAQKHQIEMPITEQVYQALFNGLDPKLAVINLLSRDQKPEH